MRSIPTGSREKLIETLTHGGYEIFVLVEIYRQDLSYLKIFKDKSLIMFDGLKMVVSS